MRAHRPRLAKRLVRVGLERAERLGVERAERPWFVMECELPHEAIDDSALGEGRAAGGRLGGEQPRTRTFESDLVSGE